MPWMWSICASLLSEWARERDCACYLNKSFMSVTFEAASLSLSFSCARGFGELFALSFGTCIFLFLLKSNSFSLYLSHAYYTFTLVFYMSCPQFVCFACSSMTYWIVPCRAVLYMNSVWSSFVIPLDLSSLWMQLAYVADNAVEIQFTCAWARMRSVSLVFNVDFKLN